jgi:comEA protein
MTVSRRSRRHPPPSDPEERLRTLGLDASPAARRLRDRVPRTEPEPGPGAGAALPRAPYAVGEADTPYRPEASGRAPAQLWAATSAPGALWSGTRAGPAPGETAVQGDGSVESTSEGAASEDERALETAPTVRLRREPGQRHQHPPPQSPWKEPPRAEKGRVRAAGQRNGPAEAASPGPWSSPRGNPVDHGEPPREDGTADRGARPFLPGGEAPQGGARQKKPSTGRGGGPEHGAAGAPEGRGPDTAERDRAEEASGGRHRRRSTTVRPPSGYTELDPEEPGSVLERAAERWGSHASLSRRAVATLMVLGLLAVVCALLVMRERPGEVTVPELVSQAAPADGGASGPPAEPDTEADGGQAPDGDVVVHVGGEVAEPGLYTMPAGSRVADAVEEAGGPLPEADLDLVNLARTLTDGERILVGVPQPEGGSGAGAEGGGALVNLNLADQAELETLPGIGQKKAQQILAHRESLGGSFNSAEDLLGVDGIAEKTFRNLEPLVTVG